MRALFEAWRGMGHKVSVVSPVSLMRELHDVVMRQHVVTHPIVEQDLRRPYYLTISDRVLPWHDLGGFLSNAMHRQALLRGFRQVKGELDFAYAHFFDSGWAAVDYCESRKLDLILGLGESMIEATERISGKERFADTLRRVKGVVAVSRDLEAFVRDRVPELEDRLVSIPNGVNSSIFHQRDRKQSRKEIGLPEDGVMLAFTGYFIDRKGATRVAEAMKRSPEVRGLFLGQGEKKPEGPQVLHAAPVSPVHMPLWLNAADFFVLPSRREGMSNAILEAMACGLPLIVSDRSFNRSFLNEDCTIFVDPDDPAAIGEAIHLLVSQPERRRAMAEAALAHAQNFTLQRRAERILSFRESLRNHPSRS